ncbi:hypothetical protein METBIDRAFT_36151 [Metschnikowia bicuspidata var. bicuspidata NRRL YB-4993]|uniref:Calponin-homology (CH) domain-containing protein n=1 Tax=Metschnikowia bicuspidata var. bicuspidata NRRL YB-4993 TaxID=869754 RepID=A0A1A0HI57_9ASCO|nr:hypothetical protein METBIDRAFT_36151 [Metschnikowia bicuspidata var. bicuspidata NRRL YB-4993]OBA23849.1 hypothetical protein METBIDRAFT_36151 [Metschnikowia bicuspidata var. bicuspidata NRRL YB-4993]
MNQNAHTNLDQDLRLSRTAKFERSEHEAAEWIFDTLQLLQTERNLYDVGEHGLAEILKDGKLLCRLGNLLGLPLAPTAKYRTSRMPFVQMENILFFLQTCDMIGVGHDEIFQTVDLFEAKDPYQVVVTLMSFSRKAHELNASAFPTLMGPKVAKVKPHVPFKPLSLRGRQ